MLKRLLPNALRTLERRPSITRINPTLDIRVCREIELHYFQDEHHAGNVEISDTKSITDQPLFFGQGVIEHLQRPIKCLFRSSDGIRIPLVLGRKNLLERG